MHCGFNTFCNLLLFTVLFAVVCCLFKVFVVLTASMSSLYSSETSIVWFLTFLIVRLVLNELKYQQLSHCDSRSCRTCYCKQGQYLFQMWDKTTQHGSVIIEIADVTLGFWADPFTGTGWICTDHKSLTTLNENFLNYVIHITLQQFH